MKIFPSHNQWTNWSLPSKLTAIGTYLGFLGIVITIFIFLFSQLKFFHPNKYEILSEIDGLRKKYNENDVPIILLAGVENKDFPIKKYIELINKLKNFSDIDIESLFEIALAKQKQEKFEESLKYAKLCFQKDSTYYKALNILGVNYYQLSKLDSAIIFLKKAEKLSLSNSDHNTHVRIQLSLGEVYLTENNYKKALFHLQAGYDKAKLYNFEFEQAIAYLDIGSTKGIAFSEYDEAIKQYLIPALNIFTKLKLKPWQAKVWANLGTIYFRIGDLDSALTKLNNSYYVFNEYNYLRDKGIVLLQLGRIYAELSEYDSAKFKFKEARNVFKNLNNTILLGTSLRQLSKIQIHFGEYNEALHNLKTALTISDIKGVGYIYNSIANIYSIIGQIDSSFIYLEMAYEIFTSLNQTASIADVEESLGSFYSDIENYEDALKHYNNAKQIYHKINHYSDEVGIDLNIANVLIDSGLVANAKRILLKSLKISLKNKWTRMTPYIYVFLGEVFLKTDNLDSAWVVLQKAEKMFTSFGDKRGSTWISYNMGIYFSKKGQYQAAESHFNRAIYESRRLHDGGVLAEILLNKANYLKNWSSKELIVESLLEAKDIFLKYKNVKKVREIEKLLSDL